MLRQNSTERPDKAGDIVTQLESKKKKSEKNEPSLHIIIYHICHSKSSLDSGGVAHKARMKKKKSRNSDGVETTHRSVVDEPIQTANKGVWNIHM